MAVTTDDLIIAIQADSKKALEGIDKLVKGIGGLDDELKDTNKTLDKTEDAVSGMGATMVKLSAAIDVATRAYDAMSRVVTGTVDAFVTQDDAVNQLRNTLTLIGTKDVAEASKGFEEFASQLQANSTIGDEVSLKYIAMAKALRLSDDQTKALVQTSADLAAVQGKDLDSSFQALLASLKGEAGELQKLAPELKNLSAEHLKNGDAIELLGKKFAGFAKAQSQTIGGSLKQVANLYGDVVEDIGRLVNDLFRFEDTEFATNALLTVQQAIADLRPIVQGIRREIDTFAARFANAVAEMEAGGTTLKEVFMGLGAVILAAFGPQVIASVVSFGGAMATAAKSAALLSGKVILIAGSVTAVASSIEIVVRNFSKLDKIGVIVVNSLIVGFRKVGDFIVDMAKRAIDAFKNVIKAVGEFFSPSNLKAIFTGGASATDVFMAKFREGFKTVNDQLSKDNETLINEIKGNAEELDFGVTGKAVTAMKNLMKGFNSEIKTGQKEAKTLGKELANAGEMGSAAMGAASKEQIAKLKEIQDQNANLALQIASADVTQSEAIQLKVERQLKALEAKKEELKLQGLLNDDIAKAIEQQAELTKAAGAKAQQSAPPQALESLQMSGEAIGSSITEAFAPVLGMAAGVNAAVGAAQAVVDAIPQMLNNISNLINSIVDLPLAIMDALQGVFDAIINAVKNLIPNLIKAVRGIIEGAIQFLMELPEVLAQAIQELPEMITSFLNDLPELAEKLIFALVKAGPDIAMSIIEFLVKDAPKLALKLAEVMAVKLPIALVKGIIDGLQEAFKSFGKLLSGNFKLDFDPKKFEKEVGKTIKKLSGDASRLFAVTDIADQAKATEKAKNLTKSVDDTVKKSLSLLQKAWKWVWEKILKPITKLVQKAWEWVKENIIDPIVNIVMKAWKWVKEKVLDPIFNLVKDAWMWVFENIVEPLTDGIMKVWEWVLEKVVDPLIDGIKAVWKWVFDTLIKPWMDVLKKVWEGIVGVLEAWGTAIMDNFKVTFEVIGDVLSSVWDGLISNLEAAWEAITGILDNTWEGLKEIWNTLMDIFTGKIGILEGVGEIFGTIFDTAKENFQEVFGFFETVADNFGETLKTITDGVGKIFDSFMNGAKDIGGAIWDGLKGGLDGLGDFFKNLFDKLSPSNLFEKIFKIDFGGKGTVEKTLGIDIPFASFARGGMVPGQASVPGDSFMNDKILALLSPGEAVIPRSMMDDPLVGRLVRAVLEGDLNPPQLFGGGTLGKLVKGDFAGAAQDVANITPAQVAEEFKSGAKAAGEFVKSMDPRNIWDQVKDVFFNNFMKIFEANKFETGGFTASGGPSLLHPGEFVMQRSAVNNIGLGNLQSMNAGKQQPQVINYNIDLPLTIENKGMPVDENFIKNRVMPTVSKELRRASLEGRFVLSTKGVRDA